MFCYVNGFLWSAIKRTYEVQYLHNSPSQTWVIILIQFITLKSNWMNPCVKTEGKCNESVNNEFKIMKKSNSLHQIMRVR